jgi:PAS domain S-box-containing protein
VDSTANNQAITNNVLAGGGEMGALMRTFDWSSTPIGPVEHWPQSLRTALSILLTSGYPMYIAWGRDYVQFYNNAYRPILGTTKHPKALGQRAAECFAESWDTFIGPPFDRALYNGEAEFVEDWMLPLDRNGFLEECFFTRSYSPIRDESGSGGGVFVTVVETTDRVLSQRRLQTLRDLASATGDQTHIDGVARVTAETLALNAADLPFTLLYRLASDTSSVSLMGSTGLSTGHRASPEQIVLSDDTDGVWKINQVIQTRQAVVVEDISGHLGEILQAGLWPEPIRSALVLPIERAGQQQPYGVLVVGISPRLKLDAAYGGFLKLVAGQVATAIGNATALEQERERAEALATLDKAKTAFFSNVSHEFRTPLTLLLAPMEDALASAEPALMGEAFHMAYRNALRLLRMVNTLLDFSRIEAGRIQASYEPTDLASFTRELASIFRSAMEKAELEFVVECAPVSEPVYIDKEMWEKIVLNLLANALKFTFTGSIRVALAEAGSCVHLTVCDTGTGIPAEELPRIFERFHRVENAQSRTYEGTGIGLALVRELVLLHGGTVEVTSTLGEGSCFTVAIPLGTNHLPTERINASRSLVSTSTGGIAFIEEAMRWSGIAQSSTTSTDFPLSVNRNPQQPSHILLADDNADMLDYLKRLLSQQHDVEAVSDGLSALAAARAHLPDLVLTDVMMPGLDGFGLLKALKADPLTNHIPVVMLSARTGDTASIGGLAAGADDYLFKPFSAHELMARINANLRVARLTSAIRQSEHQYRWLLENTTEAIWRFDVDQPVSTLLPEDEQIAQFYQAGYLANCNEGMARMYGFASAADLAGIRLTDIMPSTERQNVEYLRAFIRSGYKLVDAESVEVDIHGQTKHILNNLIGVIENKAVIRAWGTSRDITERRHAELERERLLALAQHAQREAEEGRQDLYNLFMQSPLPVCIIHGDNLVFELANPLYEQVIGRKHIAGKPLLEAMPEIAGQGFDTLLLNVMRSGTAHIGNETLLRLDRDNDGHSEDTYFTFIYAPLRSRQGLIDRIMVFCNDVTEQVVARKKVEESQARLRFMAESMPQKIFTATPDGTIDYLNRQWADFTGLAIEEIKEWGWKQVIHPDDLDSVLTRWQDAIATGVPIQWESRLRGADGVYRWHLSRAHAMRDEGGNISMWIGSNTDINDQKELQAQKDEFLSIAAHELKTPVTSLRGFAQLLLRQYDRNGKVDASQLQRSLQIIDSQSAKLSRLLSQLFDISSLEAGRLTLERQTIDVVRLVNETTQTLQRNSPLHPIVVHVPTTVTASVDPIRLEQVLVNLIDNAVKYSPNKTPVEVELTLPVPQQLRITVTDHGIGIPVDRREHIFDRFYQAHGTGHLGGMGLGLYISQQIVRLHQGQIHAEFPYDGGTRFTILLPLGLDNPLQ